MNLRLRQGLSLLCTTPLLLAFAQEGGPEIPAEYRNGKPDDAIARLAKAIDGKSETLAFEPKQGYLRAILHELHIDSSSQVLVFSKTSLQTPYIGPQSPRAIYYNDGCYVGWIPGAPNIEIVAVDPNLGPQFYTLANQRTGSPHLVRQTDECLQCHDSPMTENMPGVMTRSVYASPDGTLLTAGGSYVTTSKSPIEERWGGWYVTGDSGSQLHMGNEPARGDEQNPTIDRERGVNVTDLNRYFDTSGYLTGHSDIVSLMILEQQTTIEDAITQAAYATRAAQKNAQSMLALGWERSHIDAETAERIDHACEPLVRALVGADEPALTSPLVPSNDFAKRYALSAPADGQGRRLSELDLKTRVLKYPCSSMIYSEAFRGLPGVARDRVLGRLREILGGKDPLVRLAGVTPENRATALAILNATIS